MALSPDSLLILHRSQCAILMNREDRHPAMKPVIQDWLRATQTREIFESHPNGLRLDRSCRGSKLHPPLNPLSREACLVDDTTSPKEAVQAAILLNFFPSDLASQLLCCDPSNPGSLAEIFMGSGYWTWSGAGRSRQTLRNKLSGIRQQGDLTAPIEHLILNTEIIMDGMIKAAEQFSETLSQDPQMSLRQASELVRGSMQNCTFGAYAAKCTLNDLLGSAPLRHWKPRDASTWEGYVSKGGGYDKLASLINMDKSELLKGVSSQWLGDGNNPVALFRLSTALCNFWR